MILEDTWNRSKNKTISNTGIYTIQADSVDTVYQKMATNDNWMMYICACICDAECDVAHEHTEKNVEMIRQAHSTGHFILRCVNEFPDLGV